MTADAADARTGTSPREKKRRGRPPIVRNFYASAFEAAEAILFTEAAKVEGLDDEIDLLRTRLYKAVKSKEELKVMLRSIEVLVVLVATRYRISGEAKQELAENIAGVIQGVGDQFLPEGRRGA